VKDIFIVIGKKFASKVTKFFKSFFTAHKSSNIYLVVMTLDYDEECRIL
jgi:hypothetical protein